MYFKKKTYKQPSLEILRLENSELLAGSEDAKSTTFPISNDDDEIVDTQQSKSFEFYDEGNE